MSLIFDSVTNTYIEEDKIISVRQLLDKKKISIPPQIIQIAEANGTFDENKSPSTYYSKLYQLNTTWQIMFNTESVYFRTEGGLANVNRSNGIQGDAGRNASGKFIARANAGTITGGVFYTNNQTDAFPYQFNTSTQLSDNLNIDLSRMYTTANEFRVKNRLIRVYNLQSIEGISFTLLFRN